MKSFDDLNQNQREMLRAITDHIRERGYAPGIRDIGRATGITSTGLIHYNLTVLQRRGYIAREPRIARGIRVLEKAAATTAAAKAATVR